MSLDWRGGEVLRRMRKAAAIGINRTMAECVVSAKGLHFYTNRTHTAERQTKIVAPAQADANEAVGLWGNAQVFYFKHLMVWEKKLFGVSTLERAAGLHYKKLPGHIKEAYGA